MAFTFVLSIAGAQYQACQEEKGIYITLQNFGWPSTHPSKSYSDFLYKVCPSKYRVTHAFLAKRQCSIAEDENIQEEDIPRYANGYVDCEKLRKNVNKKNQKFLEQRTTY